MVTLMKKAAFLVIVVFAFLAVTFQANVKSVYGDDVAEDSWITVAPLPKSYYGVIGAVALDEKIFFFSDNISQCYNPQVNVWTTIASPIYNGWAAVAACQGKIYVIGSGADKPTLVYDPATDMWANKTGVSATLLSTKANVVDDKIYVISGALPAPLGVFAPSEITYVYDPKTDSWKSMAPIPTPVAGYASVVVDNKIYIIGGGPSTDYRKPDANSPTTVVQIFNPATNQWTTGQPLLKGVINAGACLTSGLLAPKRIYVVGGSDFHSAGGTSADMMYHGTNLNQVYDFQTEKWSYAASLPQMRSRLSLVNVNDALYAVGGLNGTDYGITVSADLHDWENARQQMSQTKVQSTEKYIPVGYKGPATPPPTASQNPPSKASPSSAYDNYIINLFTTMPNVAIFAIIVVITIAGLAVYRKKFKNKKGFDSLH